VGGKEERKKGYKTKKSGATMAVARLCQSLESSAKGDGWFTEPGEGTGLAVTKC
jgi:hypothetical protein